MGSPGAEHYEVLGVDPASSMAEIRRSYLRLARVAHPDFHNGSERARIAAEVRMRQINASWAVLSDVDQRSAYDRTRLTGASRPSIHASGHGPAEDPESWRPYDSGPDDGFDEDDDRPITTAALPSWMKTVPALGVLFGVAALLVGSLVDISSVAEIGLLLLMISGFLFLAAPLVALSLSKGQDRRP